MIEKNNPENKPGSSVPTKYILLGEDDIDDEEIIEEIFFAIDPSLQVQFIDNGQKLISYLEEVTDNLLPCLIILDFNMPGLNGAEILKNLNHNQRVQHVPKIIWSTSNAPAYKKMCLELGARDYLVKPSRIKDLEQMIRHMLSYC